MSAISAYELRYLLLRGPGRVKKENVQRLSAAFASVRNVLPVTGAVAPGLGQLRNLPRLQQLDQMRVFKSLGTSGLRAIMPRTSAPGAGLGDYTLKALCAYARRSAVICC